MRPRTSSRVRTTSRTSTPRPAAMAYTSGAGSVTIRARLPMASPMSLTSPSYVYRSGPTASRAESSPAPAASTASEARSST